MFAFLYLVLQLERTVCAQQQQGYFTVQHGYSVTTVYSSTTARTLLQCSNACRAQNDVTPGTCLAATYNGVTKQCSFSSQTATTLNPATKTVILSKVCGLPPLLSNANLVVTSATPSGSTAAVSCQAGLIACPTSVQCLPNMGWNSNGFDCVPPPVYSGTSFIFGFMQNGESNDGIPKIFISSPDSAALVSVSIPALNIVNEQHTLTAGSLTLTYSTTISSATSGAIANKGVYVTADRPITVFAGSFVDGSADGSLVLPETSLGTNYIISGHPSTNAGTDEFLIIGTVDATSITMNINSVTQSITLNRMQSYMHAGVDLSGSMISSSHPVYVLSGHMCANIPDNTVLYCDYIDEAMPPISSLGTVHVISYMKPRPAFTISISAPYSLTSVTVYNAAGNVLETVPTMMQTDAIFRTYPGSQSLSVVASQPVLVAQYGQGSSLSGGDPSMMFIPDVNHFGHHYDFVVPSGFNVPSTVAIVMHASYSSTGLLLNGIAFTPSEIRTVTIPGYGNYTILYGSLTVGYHSLAHTAGTGVSFGCWIFGYNTYQEYAWSLGYV